MWLMKNKRSENDKHNISINVGSQDVSNVFKSMEMALNLLASNIEILKTNFETNEREHQEIWKEIQKAKKRINKLEGKNGN